jgi:hypothetical protein
MALVGCFFNSFFGFGMWFAYLLFKYGSAGWLFVKIIF